MLSPDKIPVGTIAVAYDLNGPEIDTLIKHVGATIDCSWITSLAEFDLFSVSAYFPELRNYTYKNTDKLKAALQRGQTLEVKRPLINILLPCCVPKVGTTMDYNNVWAGEDDEFNDGTEALYYIFRDLSLVSKRKSVLFLNSRDYLIIKDVKALSKKIVDKIIENETHSQSDEKLASSGQAINKQSKSDFFEQPPITTENLPIPSNQGVESPPMLNKSEIVVKNRIAPMVEGSGKTQLRNTIEENKEAFDKIQAMLANEISITDIAAHITGGRKVAACLLFSNSNSPEAAFKALLRAEQKK